MERRTWDEWVTYLRSCEARISEAEVDQVIGLMNLERQPSLWRPRGSQTFGQLINDPLQLGLSISPKRYEAAKAALATFGEKKVRTLGLPAMRRALQVHGEARDKYLKMVREWKKKFRRAPSDQAAWRMMREAAPPVPKKTVVSIVDRLRSQLEAARQENLRLRERIEDLVGVQEMVRTFHAMNGYKFNFQKALAEVQIDRRKKSTA